MSRRSTRTSGRRRRLFDLVAARPARSGVRADISQFALHPSGPRILEACAESLDLPCSSYRHSMDVFRNQGNMSSATLPHIWAGILADPTIGAGGLVCSVAFGPGLTVCGNLLRVLRP